MEPDMKEDLTKYSPSDPELVDKIVNTIKSKGIFDQFRKDCLADVDTKPAYQNLQRRVNGSVNGFLNSHKKWPCAQNKTQLRESVRKHTVKQSFLEAGVDRIVDQVVMPKIYSVFHPKVEEIVYELLGLEKPKPKPKKPEPKSILDLKLDFQNFKKSLNEASTTKKEPVRDRIESSPVPSFTQNEEPQAKEEAESQPNYPDTPNTPPPLETNGEAVSDVQPEDISMSPASHKSAIEVLNNDDDSNTIDEMPLLAASMDNSNRATTPVLSTARNDSNAKVDSSSDSDSHSLPSSQPPMEFDSSANNISSLKSDCKVSPSKKFDNFSNLGEKLKQSDVNLRETTLAKTEENTEESSEVTKSSEHDSESLDLNMDVHSDSNTSAVERYFVEKNETLHSSHYSDDSMSSAKSKSKSLDFKKNDRSHSQKQGTDNKPKNTLPETMEVEKDRERSSQNPADDHKEHSKSTSKYSDSKTRTDTAKDKLKIQKHKYEKQRSKDAHSSERNGKDNDERKDEVDANSEKKSAGQKNDSTDKLAVDETERRKKKEEKSRSTKEDGDSKSSKKGEDHSKSKGKGEGKFKTPEKEKKSDDKNRTDRLKTKSDSSRKSSHSKSEDKKSRDERKKDERKNREDGKNDKKDKEDDKKKESKKRKSGRCDENDSKSKNSRRSSDRDSNGNAGGGSDKSKPTSTSQTPKKSSKSEKKTRSKYKDPSNSDALEENDSRLVTDEVDLILLQINNSIENKQHRLDVREILNEPSVTPSIKPKIAKNFHEIRKIMQARKNINRLNGLDTGGLSPSNEAVIETIPSKAEIVTNIDRELGTDSSADVDDEMTNDEVDEIELKGLSVIITDIMKDSSQNASKSNFDPLSNFGVSFFLGSDDAIIRVEQCSSVSETQSDDDGYPSPVYQSPEEVSPKMKVTRTLIPMEFMQSCADVEKDVGSHETVITPSNASKEDILGTDSTPSVTFKATKVSVGAHDLPELYSKSAETFVNGDNADDDDNSIKSERTDTSHKSLKELPDCVATTENDKSNRKLERSSKQNGSGTLPTHSSTRNNAGSRMYAILEEVSSSKHSNALAERGIKRKTSKSRSNSDTERHSRPESPRVPFEIGEQSSMVVEASSSKEGNDDGSDVSNKENDETNASVAIRLKNQKADQSAMVETRSTRKKNQSLDKPDESMILFKPDVGKTSGAKSRLSLSPKNGANDPESIIIIDDDDLGKPCMDYSSRPCTRRSASSLNAKIRDSEENWLSKGNPCSSSKIDPVRKSLECLQMEKENLTVCRISGSQSSEPNAQTLALSPRRKSCPDILHPRDYCENKDPVKDKSSSASDRGVPESHIEVCNDDIVENANKSKMAAIKLPINNNISKKQFEYRTRSINNQRKSISVDRGDKKEDDLNENEQITSEEGETEIGVPDYSCTRRSITRPRASAKKAKTDGEISTKGQGQRDSSTTRERKPTVMSVESVEGNYGDLKNEDIISNCVTSNTGEPSKNTDVIYSVLSKAGEIPNLTEISKTEKVMEEENNLTSSERMIISSTAAEQKVQSNVHNSCDKQQQKSARMLKKKSSPSAPNKELPDFTENGTKGSTLSQKQKIGSADVPKCELKKDEKLLDKPVSNPSSSNLSERPKRRSSLPLWRREDSYVLHTPPKTEGNNKRANPILPVQAAAELHSSRLCNSKQYLKTATGTKLTAQNKSGTESEGITEKKRARPSKRDALTITKSSTTEKDTNGDSVSKVADVKSSDVIVEDVRTKIASKFLKNKHATLMNLSNVDSLLEDSTSSSSLEFKGFSEDDNEPESDEECLGFSDREIQKATAQLCLLTHFIANHDSSIAKSNVTTQPQIKKMRASSDVAKQPTLQPAKKRKLSLSSTPEKDTRDVLDSQCKAESKDSGLCESPEQQPSFATNVICQKIISVDHRSPVNGVRTKSVRTPAPLPERNRKTLVKTDTVKSRNSQRYCASDLYKPRPSFARDVRAVKRTASPDTSILGRAKKRSR